MNELQFENFESVTINEAMMASVDGEPHPAEDFAEVPDPNKPSTWKFPIFDKAHIDNAVARLNQTNISADRLPAVKAKIRAAWEKQYPDRQDMPSILKEAGAQFSGKNQGAIKTIINNIGNELKQLGALILPPVPTNNPQPQPTGESANLGNIITIEESASADNSHTMYMKIIKPGWGSSGYYSDKMLASSESAVPAGTKMFWNHPKKSDVVDRPERDLRDLAAVTTEGAKYLSNGPDGPGLYAKSKVFEGYWPAVKDLHRHIGLSIRGGGLVTEGEAEGRYGNIIQEFDGQLNSVDFVTTPGAGGEILNLFESARDNNIVSKKIIISEITENGSEVKDIMSKELEEKINKRIANLEEANKKLQEQNAKFQDSWQRAQVEKYVVQKVSHLNESMGRRIVTTVIENYPIDDNGMLDTDKFDKVIESAIENEQNYVNSFVGDTKVLGMGGTIQAEPIKDFEKEVSEGLQRLGVSKDVAEAAK